MSFRRGSSDRGCAIRGCRARDLPKVHRGTRPRSIPLQGPAVRRRDLATGPQTRAGAPSRCRRRDREAKVLEAGGIGWGPGACFCSLAQGQRRRQHGKRLQPHESSRAQSHVPCPPRTRAVARARPAAEAKAGLPSSNLATTYQRTPKSRSNLLQANLVLRTNDEHSVDRFEVYRVQC